MYRLVHLTGDSRGRRQRIHRRRIQAGSDLGCMLWINDEAVAPRQVELTAGEGEVWMEDLRPEFSAVFVNGHAASSAHLHRGDRLEIGPLAVRIEIPRHRSTTERRRLALLAGIALLLVPVARRAWRSDPGAGTGTLPDSLTAPEIALRQFAQPAPALDASEALDRLLEEIRPEDMPPERLAPGTTGADAQAERVRRAELILERAQDAVRRRDFETAHGILDRLQAAFPRFLPAHAARARLFEQQGRPFDAERQWLRLLQQDVFDPLFNEAADALARLAVIDPPPPDVIPPAERMPAAAPPSQPPPAARPPGRVRIASAEPMRFPGSDDYDEMRVIRFTLTADGPRPPARDVLLHVRIYDRALPENRILPTRAHGPLAPIPLPDSAWPAEGKTVSVSYVVPRGHRAREQQATGQRVEYFGFVAWVTVDGGETHRMTRPQGIEALTGALR